MTDAAGARPPPGGEPARFALLLFLSLVLGALAALSFAPASLFYGPILALAVLLLMWRAAGSARRAAALGYAFGLGLFGAGVSWVYVSLADFGGMPEFIAVLATAMFCMILALYPAAVGCAQHRLGGSFPMRALLTVPALWALADWLRDVVTGFPWLAWGYSQVGTSPLTAYAPIFGVFGVSLATALAAGLLALALSPGLDRFVDRTTPGAVMPQAAFPHTFPLLSFFCGAGLLALFGLGFGLRDITWTEPAGPPLKVALLQGNIAQNLKFEEEWYQQTLTTYRTLALSTDARLVVWPETAIPRLLDTVDEDYLEGLKKRAVAAGADMLIGVPHRDEQDRYYNSVVSFGASRTQSYSKTHLVPFGEFIPTGFHWVLVILNIPMGEFTRGADDPAPLAVAGTQVAVNICYEDAFGEEIIRQLPAANLLVNVSNVAWFGHSIAPDQHLQISRMRAIETGRPMLRATNTGVTAAIDADGKVIAALPQFIEAVLTARVQPRAGATPFIRAGNLPLLAIVFAMLAVAAALGRRAPGSR
jgi:apolipoprotein N-acyltransferase